MYHFNQFHKTVSGIFFFIGVTIGLAPNGNAGTIQNRLKTANLLRMTAKQQGEIVPYRQEQFKALKAYFSEMNGFANDLKESSNYSWQFNNAVSWEDMSALCSELFFVKSEWQNIVKRCTRNNFFLCAEEVKTYPETVSAIREMLATKQQKRFDETPSCQAVFAEL